MVFDAPTVYLIGLDRSIELIQSESLAFQIDLAAKSEQIRQLSMMVACSTCSLKNCAL